MKAYLQRALGILSRLILIWNYLSWNGRHGDQKRIIRASSSTTNIANACLQMLWKRCKRGRPEAQLTARPGALNLHHKPKKGGIFLRSVWVRRVIGFCFDLLLVDSHSFPWFILFYYYSFFFRFLFIRVSIGLSVSGPIMVCNWVFGLPHATTDFDFYYC